MEFRLSKGHFLGLFCAVVWGATFISTKVLLEYLSPLQILFSRFLLGYIALWCLYPHRSPKYGRKAQLLFALAGFLGTFLYFLMENVALQHTTASNVGVLVSLAPLFTAAVSKLENPKLTLSLQFFVGAVLSFVGVLLIVFGDNMSLVINPLGDTLALGAAFVWALYSIVLNKLSVYKAPILVSTRTIFGYGLIFIVAGVLYADDFPLVLPKLLPGTAMMYDRPLFLFSSFVFMTLTSYRSSKGRRNRFSSERFSGWIT